MEDGYRKEYEAQKLREKEEYDEQKRVYRMIRAFEQKTIARVNARRKST